jgi:hypothetical protein
MTTAPTCGCVCVFCGLLRIFLSQDMLAFIRRREEKSLKQIIFTSRDKEEKNKKIIGLFSHAVIL